MADMRKVPIMREPEDSNDRMERIEENVFFLHGTDA